MTCLGRVKFYWRDEQPDIDLNSLSMSFVFHSSDIVDVD